MQRKRKRGEADRMKKFVKGWLSYWLYIIVMISGIIIGITAMKWGEWNLQTKLFALATALLPLHVLEEWHFPGGFHYMYNYLEKSHKPDRYPMNQLTDMLTNFIGVAFGCIVLVVGVIPFTAVMQCLLCAGEIMAHTKSGFTMKKELASKGKRTIYNPGLFTSLFGYLPLLIGLIISFITENAPSLLEVVLAILFGGILMGISLVGMEKLFKDQDTPYGYDWGNGYFEKYCK